jgi:hypothetical protein
MNADIGLWFFAIIVGFFLVTGLITWFVEKPDLRVTQSKVKKINNDKTIEGEKKRRIINVKKTYTLETYIKYIFTGYSLYIGVYILGAFVVSQVARKPGQSELFGHLWFILPLINGIVAFMIIFYGEKKRRKSMWIMWLHALILFTIGMVWFFYNVSLWVRFYWE